MNTNLFHLGWADVAKGLVMAVLTGALLPIAAAVQTPGFNITSVSWHAVEILALNGAIIGFVGYIAKNFMSDQAGKVFGKIG